MNNLNLADIRLPLTSQQRRFWYIYQCNRGRDKNMLLRAIRFNERVDRNGLDQVVTHVFNRHQLLKSDIHIGHDIWPMFRVHPEVIIKIPWDKKDIITLPVTPENVPEEIGIGFDLTHERPWRLYGLRTSEADYLIFAIHHIICDEISLRIIVREIDEALSALHIPPLSSTPGISEGDFEQSVSIILHEQEQQRREGGLQFWQETLAGAPIALNLPTESTIESADMDVYRAESFCGGDLLIQLNQFARQQQLTFPVILASIFTAVLSRYSDESEVVVGMPVSLRPPHDKLRAVGPFLNVLPLRCEIGRSLTFTTLCQSIWNSLMSALDFSAIPFEEIVQIANQEKLSGRHPIFQATLSYHDLRESGEREMKHCQEVPSWSGSLSCDLSLTCEYHYDRLYLFIDGDKRLYSPAFLNRLIEQIVYGLSVCLAEPKELLSSLIFIPLNQRQVLLEQLSGINQKHKNLPILPAIIDSSVNFSDSMAISGSLTLSYNQLMRRATRIAWELRTRGVQTGDFILIGIEENLHPIAEILGVMLSGAAWVPVNKLWPQHQIAMVADKVKSRFSLGASLPLEKVKAISVTEEASLEFNVIFSSEMSAMYAISTSGTTGEPKVVAIPWRGIANRFSWMTSMFGESQPVTLKTTPYIYDSSVWQLLWPLTSGGRCVLPERDQIFDHVALAELVEKEKITVIDFVPSILNSLLPGLESSEILRLKLQTLRWVIIGAEALPVATAKRIKKLLPNTKIINSYGPTEASIGCVYQTIDDSFKSNIPIGNPIPNVQVAIIDKRQHLAPMGALGELLLMGDCVGLGYVGSEDQKGFISVDLSPYLKGRAYRTGDWVRWNELGQLEFIARMDKQVKLRGVRIELSAIESVLETFPNIIGSYSQIITQENGRETLVSFIKTTNTESLDKAELIEKLKRTLQKSVIPEHIIILDSFPLASSGKIDSKALAEKFIDYQRPKARINNTKSLSPVESIWKRVINTTDSIDHDLNFFDAGGHSLLLVDLQQELNCYFGAHFSIVDLFNYPTISDQEKLLSNSQKSTADKNKI